MWVYLVWSSNGYHPWLERVMSNQDEAIAWAKEEYDKPDNYDSWLVIQLRVDSIGEKGYMLGKTIWKSE